MNAFGRLLRWSPLHKALPFLVAALALAPFILTTRSAYVRMTIYSSRATLDVPTNGGQVLLAPLSASELTLSGPATAKSMDGTSFSLAQVPGGQKAPKTSIQLDEPTSRLTLTSPADSPLRIVAVDLRRVSNLDVRHGGGADAPMAFYLWTSEPVALTARALEFSVRCVGCRPDADSKAADWAGSAQPDVAGDPRGAFATLSAGAPGVGFAIASTSPWVISQPTEVTGSIAFETMSADGKRRVSALTQKSEIVIEDTGRKIDVEPSEFVVVGQPHKLKLLSLSRAEGAGLKLEFHGEVPSLSTGRSPQSLKNQLPSWLSYWYQKKDEAWLLWLSVSLLLGGMLLKIAIEIGWVKGKDKS